jgi:hypothetical protein
LLEDFLKTANDEGMQKEIKGYLEDVNAEKAVFNNMIKTLVDNSEEKKIVIANRDVLITKADETGIEGNGDGVTYTKRWIDIAPSLVLGLFPEDLTESERFYLGTWCYNHNLVSDGEKILVEWLGENSGEKWLVDRFLCRYKNISLPPGGFAEYKGQLVTSEEKSYLEKGLIKYKERWMVYEEMMKAKGMVKCQDRWVTPVEKSKIEQEINALEQIRNRFAPKGVINKLGADAERLPWNKARVKKTDHYIIKTNLSADALDDICFFMECYYFKAQPIFKSNLKTAQLNINVFATEEEYYKNGGPRGSRGVFIFDGGAQILTYYQPPITLCVLAHEGTHAFVHLACGSYGSDIPIWIDEGLTTYFESSKLDGNMFKINLINNNRLMTIQKLITEKEVTRMEDFIHIPQEDFGINEYAHAWSLVYFFINYNNGQYMGLLDKYFELIKKRGLNALADKKQHIKMFEESFKTKFEVLEKEWKDYIMKLEPATEDESPEI